MPWAPCESGSEEAWLGFVAEGPSAMRRDLPDSVTRAGLAAGTAREVLRLRSPNE